MATLRDTFASWPRTAGASSSGWSRTATPSRPASPSCGSTRRRYRHDAPSAQISPPSGAPHARILGVGGYRPARVVPTPRSATASTPPTSGSASAPASCRAAGPRRTRRSSTWPRRRPGKALDAAGMDPSRIGAVLVATVTHPFQTPSAAARSPTGSGGDPGCGHRHLGRVRRLLLRRRDGRRHGPRRQRRVRAGHRRREALGLHRLRRPLDRVHLRRRRRRRGDRPSDNPGIGPTIWGSDG